MIDSNEALLTRVLPFPYHIKPNTSEVYAGSIRVASFYSIHEAELFLKSVALFKDATHDLLDQVRSLEVELADTTKELEDIREINA